MLLAWPFQSWLALWQALPLTAALASAGLMVPAAPLAVAADKGALLLPQAAANAAQRAAAAVSNRCGFMVCMVSTPKHFFVCVHCGAKTCHQRVAGWIYQHCR
jgi:hypothetical protein